MFKHIFIILLFTVTSGVAQKRLSQSYSANGVKELFVQSNEIFQINIVARETDQILVHTIIDGETYESTLLNTIIKDEILKITTPKMPGFKPYNDKLSAHKVMAIELEIVVPLGLDIWVYSGLASLDVRGELGQVRVDLGRGHFVGKEFRFRESAKINTLSGSITIAVSQARVSAASRNGTVTIDEGLATGFPLEIESLHGNIMVTKSP